MDTRDLLRLTTAGSVDDGKSTLIGRLLLESSALHQDQLEAVRRDSQKRGHQDLDLSLFTDGLRAEREQKITIDVAYRYFSTPRRKFIIADCPGHIQYTRNMVTGASTSELAVILVDARHGLVTQSKRHAFLSTLLGLPHLVVAVNKMDLVAYSQDAYLNLCDAFRAFAEKLEVHSLTFLPVSALHGDNVVERSSRMPWYDGGTLLHHLETVNVGATRNVVDFRFPIQTVLRPHQDYRGYAGRVVSGRIAVGEEVVVLPSGSASRVHAIEVYQSTRLEAKVGESVVLRLEDHVDAARGDMIVRRNNLPTSSDEIDAIVCWLASEPLELSKNYTLMHGTRRLPARIARLHYRIDVDTMHRQVAGSLGLNDIGRLRIATAQPLYFDAYRQNRETGCFLLIDPSTHDTVAGGMIRGQAHPLSELDTPHGQTQETSDGRLTAATDRSPSRQQLFGHQPGVIWLTGLSGAGKSTLARQLELHLLQLGARLLTIDGDSLRSGLSADLGFSPSDRQEAVRRAAHLAALAYRQGMIAIVSLISPFARDRDAARALIPSGFFEVHVHCPLQVCQARDPKGLYGRALRGEIPEFTGIGSPYEEPARPELKLDTAKLSLQQSLQRLLESLREAGILPG
jgi:bifunctional enzyme CysN/CysC